MNDEEKADFASREGGKNLISRQKLKLDFVCKYRLLEKGFEENKFETCRLHRSVSKVFKAKLFSTSSLLNLFTNSRNFLKLLLITCKRQWKNKSKFARVEISFFRNSNVKRNY